LCEGWLIKLVVTELSVSDKINNNILVEFLSKLGSKFEGSLHIFHAVSVYVENWSVDTLCYI
jgi:hypothetical protein